MRSKLQIPAGDTGKTSFFWRKKGRAGFLVFVLSLCFIGYGIWNGEVRAVYQKAAAICLECIGIG